MTNYDPAMTSSDEQFELYLRKKHLLISYRILLKQNGMQTCLVLLHKRSGSYGRAIVPLYENIPL